MLIKARCYCKMVDTVCFDNLECVLKFPVTLIKTKKHPSFTDYEYVLNNAFISAEPKNIFIENCINNAINFDVKNMKPIDHTRVWIVHCVIF